MENTPQTNDLVAVVTGSRIPQGFVRCNYDGKLIKEEEAFRSPGGSPYHNAKCYEMFVED